ncbi:MAG: DUF4142 domain-containing protein [Pseudomonadota bacterium]|nr:DUF4142 domain-containing protein [Pseudomonadota bacterium]
MLTSPQTSAARSARRLLSQTLLAAALSALAVTALPVAAQGSGASTTPDTGSTSSGSAAGMPGTMSGTATGTKVTREDSLMMTNLAQANIAEIETGRMALGKSRNEQVRKFAQQMVDDHTSALQALQTLAQAKGITLPEETDLRYKSLATALKMMSGNTFDNQYLKRVGINAHQRTIELLQKAQSDSKDTEVQALVTKMLPSVQGHLQMARQIVVQMTGASGRAASSAR